MHYAQLTGGQECVQVLSLWLWLSYRFKPDSFPGRDIAETRADTIIEMMESGLQACAPAPS